MGPQQVEYDFGSMLSMHIYIYTYDEEPYGVLLLIIQAAILIALCYLRVHPFFGFLGRRHGAPKPKPSTFGVCNSPPHNPKPNY